MHKNYKKESQKTIEGKQRNKLTTKKDITTNLKHQNDDGKAELLQRDTSVLQKDTKQTQGEGQWSQTKQNQNKDTQKYYRDAKQI